MMTPERLVAWAALAQAAPPQQSWLLAYGAGAVVFVSLLLLAFKLLARRRARALCANVECGAENDPRARFCRRCGKALVGATRAGARA